MKLESIQLREIRLPLKEPFRISSGVVSERPILLLELHDADGHVAWSECVAGENPNYSSETIDTAWHAVQSWLAPRIMRAALDDPRAAAERLGEGVRGHAMAKAAVEMGCWVIDAQRRNLSLAEVLGGVREWVPVGISLGIQDTPAALVERAQAAQEAGYRKIKLKIAPGADIEFVAAVREALGPSGDDIVVDVFDGGTDGAGHALSNYAAHLGDHLDPAVVDFLTSVGQAGYAGPGSAVAVDVSVP
jgi:O-succinylbenzoate synthase